MITVMIAASGSGGHLLPARYLADEFLARGARVVVLGSGRPLEDDIFGDRYERRVISAVGLAGRGARGVVEFVASLPRTFTEMRRLLAEFTPDAIVGVGGYVTFMPVLLGYGRGIPTWIHEAELAAGNANRFLSLVATRVSLAFHESRMPWWARTVFTGHPLRPELANFSKVFPDRPRHLLVVGGSQGARALDEAATVIAKLARCHALGVTHVARPEGVNGVIERYRAEQIDALVVPFLHDPVEAYRRADLVIARSGAGSTLELAVTGIPVILVPFPAAQGDHQTKNALTLVRTGQGRLVPEGPDFHERLGQALSEICSQPERYQTMVHAPAVDRARNGTSRIVDGVYELIRACGKSSS